MSSIAPTLIAIVILGAIAYLIWRARPTRDSLREKRAAAAGLTAEDFAKFEQHAARIALSVFAAAEGRLQRDANRQGLPTTAELDTSTGCEPLGTGSRMRGAAREWVDAVRRYRRLHEEAFGTSECDRAEEHMAYLTVAYTDRYPLLLGLIDRQDLSGLERIATGPARDAARILRDELDSRLRTYAEIRETLEEDPTVVWSILSLVVLALSDAEFGPEQQAALAARANARNTDSWVALMSAQLKTALRIAHSIPPAERRCHDGVLALPLDDARLGAALVQYHANQATALGELDQARVLVMGDSHMLWLAHDVVRARPYPEEAVGAYARLAPAVRKALAQEPDADAAFGALEAVAQEELDAVTTTRVLECVRQLRSGLSAEQVRAGTTGHEAASEQAT